MPVVEGAYERYNHQFPEGAVVFFNLMTPKFAANATKKLAEIDWKPTHLLSEASLLAGTVLKPAAFEVAHSILSAGSTKHATNQAWKDSGFKQWSAFMDQYYPTYDLLSVRETWNMRGPAMVGVADEIDQQCT